MVLIFVEEISKFDKVSFVEVGEEHAGQRLDNFLIRHLKGVPKSRIYNLLRKGEVRVNKGRVKPDTRVKVGDLVRIAPIRVAERGALSRPVWPQVRCLRPSERKHSHPMGGK